MGRTIVVSVGSQAEKDIVLKCLCNQYGIGWEDYYWVELFGINTLKVYHKEGDVAEHLRSVAVTYKVVVIPVNIDIEPLRNFAGVIDWRLDSTIKVLEDKLRELKFLQEGKAKIKETADAATRRELARCLP